MKSISTGKAESLYLRKEFLFYSRINFIVNNRKSLWVLLPFFFLTFQYNWLDGRKWEMWAIKWLHDSPNLIDCFSPEVAGQFTTSKMLKCCRCSMHWAGLFRGEGLLGSLLPPGHALVIFMLLSLDNWEFASQCSPGLLASPISQSSQSGREKDSRGNSKVEGELQRRATPPGTPHVP